MSQTNQELSTDFYQLARMALTGRQQDVQLFIHRITKRYKNEYPSLTRDLISLLQQSPNQASPIRGREGVFQLPVDVDSRLHLLRLDHGQLDGEPVLSDELSPALSQIITERNNPAALFNLGLQPTKTVLLTGPPGVGKTMTARWIASQLHVPLLILDLAAVMSSFLGKTGNNIRQVLDYAKSVNCVLLLDELDSVAKRRDDNSEIGELKRLVTVLLQEIDDWPSTALLMAATNHPSLLDPAIWRRFEVILNFSNPTDSQLVLFLGRQLAPYTKDHEIWSRIFSYVFSGQSYSDIEKKILWARKSAALSNSSIEDALHQILLSTPGIPHDKKILLACQLIGSGLVSQRKAQEITGLSRDTIRKHYKAIKEPS